MPHGPRISPWAQPIRYLFSTQDLSLFGGTPVAAGPKLTLAICLCAGLGLSAYGIAVQEEAAKPGPVPEDCRAVAQELAAAREQSGRPWSAMLGTPERKALTECAARPVVPTS